MGFQRGVTISHCYNVPEGMLTIVCSSWWLILRNKVNTHCHNTEAWSSTWVDPKVAFENFQKDCVVQKYFHMLYEKYMECIIDAIIAHQGKADNINIVPRDNKRVSQQDKQACTLINPSLTVSNSTSDIWVLSSNLGVTLDSHTNHGVTGRDMYLPEKHLGHITLQATGFNFVGHDRHPV